MNLVPLGFKRSCATKAARSLVDISNAEAVPRSKKLIHASPLHSNSEADAGSWRPCSRRMRLAESPTKPQVNGRLNAKEHAATRMAFLRLFGVANKDQVDLVGISLSYPIQFIPTIAG